ncbi:MAG TPA: hypothetical protein VGE52_07240 [Pirellulales bacterium]
MLMLQYAIVALGVVFVALLLLFVVKAAFAFFALLRSGSPSQTLWSLLLLSWLVAPSGVDEGGDFSEGGDFGGEE